MKEETQGIIAELDNRGRLEAFDEFKEDTLDYFSDSPFYEEILEYFQNYSLNHQI